MRRPIPPFLVRSLAYPLHRAQTGVDAQGAADRLEPIQWWSAEQIASYQDRRLRELIRSIATIPYYREVFRDLGLDPQEFGGTRDLTKLPLLDKDLIRDNESRMRVGSVSDRDLKANSTGGSSGQNLHFTHDRATRAGIMGSQLVNWRWVGAGDGKPIAYLWGSPIETQQAKALVGRVKNTLQNVLYLSCFGLDETLIQNYEAQLRAFQPKVLIGYPSALSQFARSLLDRRRPPVPVASIICTSEVMLDEEQEVIERGFGARVFNRYGCREVGDIAHECDHHTGLHVNSGRLVVELLPTPEGDHEVVVTDLDNTTMPFLRYRMGDLAEWYEGMCPCGRGLPMLSAVTGRKFDLILSPNGASLPGTFWTHLFRSIPGVAAFRVIQSELTQLQVLLQPNEELGPDAVEWFGAEIQKLAGPELVANFELVDQIPPHPSGKRRFVISELANSRETAR